MNGRSDEKMRQVVAGCVDRITNSPNDPVDPEPAGTIRARITGS